MLKRKQSDSTKAKISAKMTQIHAQRSDSEKEQIRQKQSQTMKQNWQKIPKTTIDDILAEEGYNACEKGTKQPTRINPQNRKNN